MVGEWTTSMRMRGWTRREAGHAIAHSTRTEQTITPENPDVDASRTALNVLTVNDGAGRQVPMSDRRQAFAFLDDRISQLQSYRTVTDKKTGEKTKKPVALRKDANVAVEVVLQLDPKFTGTSEELLKPGNEKKREEVSRLLRSMVDEMTTFAGEENVIAVTEQWDETNPHVQMFFVPEHEGSVSMKKKVGGDKGKAEAQKTYAGLHQTLRERLRSEGYDATDEVKGGTHSDYRTFKQLREEREEVEWDRQITAGARQVLDDERAKLEDERRLLQERAKQLDARERDLDTQRRADQEWTTRVVREAREAKEKAEEAERQRLGAAKTFHAAADALPGLDRTREVIKAHARTFEQTQTQLAHLNRPAPIPPTYSPPPRPQAPAREDDGLEF